MELAAQIDTEDTCMYCIRLGQHILRLSPEERLPGRARSCNLNELAGRAVQQSSEPAVFELHYRDRPSPGSRRPWGPE